MSQQSGEFEAMEPDWRVLLEYLASIDDILVVRFIGNDCKAQIMRRMLPLGIKPKLKPKAGNELVKSLKYADGRQYGDLAASVQSCLRAVQF